MMREVVIMRKYIVLAVMLAALLGAACLEAKELVISPAKVETIVSPEDGRDSRVLVYFELPRELYGKKVVIDNAVLMFEAQVTDAEFGMVHIFPVTREWQSASSIAWDSPWSSSGGDYTTEIAGKSITLKEAKGEGAVLSNVTFIVMDWIAGRLPNNGFILVPSQEDLVDSSVRFAFDKGSLKLKIECTK